MSQINNIFNFLKKNTIISLGIIIFIIFIIYIIFIQKSPDKEEFHEPSNLTYINFSLPTESQYFAINKNNELLLQTNLINEFSTFYFIEKTGTKPFSFKFKQISSKDSVTYEAEQINSNYLIKQNERYIYRDTKNDPKKLFLLDKNDPKKQPLEFTLTSTNVPIHQFFLDQTIEHPPKIVKNKKKIFNFDIDSLLSITEDGSSSLNSVPGPLTETKFKSWDDPE